MRGAASTALGASLHIGGSVFIVLGQTTLKVAQLINETSSCKQTWKVVADPGQQPPQWWAHALLLCSLVADVLHRGVKNRRHLYLIKSCA